MQETTMLAKTTNIIKVDQIKSEFIIYGVFNTVLDQYINYKRYDIFKKKYLYFYSEQNVLLKKYDLDIYDILNFIKDNELPKKYNPKITNITKNAVDYFDRKRRLDRIRSLIKKLRSYSIETIISDTKLRFKYESLKYLESGEKELANFEFHEISFNISIISLFQQKEYYTEYQTEKQELQKRITEFFIEYTKSNGETFDNYIDIWVKKLMKEFDMRKKVSK